MYNKNTHSLVASYIFCELILHFIFSLCFRPISHLLQKSSRLCSTPDTKMFLDPKSCPPASHPCRLIRCGSVSWKRSRALYYHYYYYSILLSKVILCVGNTGHTQHALTMCTTTNTHRTASLIGVAYRKHECCESGSTQLVRISSNSESGSCPMSSKYILIII